MSSELRQYVTSEKNEIHVRICLAELRELCSEQRAPATVNTAVQSFLAPTAFKTKLAIFGGRSGKLPFPAAVFTILSETKRGEKLLR